MHGFKEDLMNAVIADIVENWEPMGGNLTYFVDRVRQSGIPVRELDHYLHCQTEDSPESVSRVFAAIVYSDYLENQQKGGDQ